LCCAAFALAVQAAFTVSATHVSTLAIPCKVPSCKAPSRLASRARWRAVSRCVWRPRQAEAGSAVSAMFAPGFPAAAASPRSPRFGLLVLAERLLDGGCFGLTLLGWGRLACCRKAAAWPEASDHLGARGKEPEHDRHHPRDCRTARPYAGGI
jgi:hypothetical protein